MTLEFLKLCRFIRGEQYAIGLALLVDGKVVLGVMACPKLPLASTAAGINANKSSPEKVGCLFFGAVGTGAYVQSLNALDSPPVKVKPTLRDTLVSICFAQCY